LENFKILVDILSSIASIVAIATVLYSWYSSKKNPIEIPEVIVSKYSEDTFRFIIKIKNRKPYPVIVKSMTCYKRKTHLVEKKRMERPRTTSMFDTRDRILTTQNELPVSELGEHLVDINTKIDLSPLKTLIFLAYTSHGFLTIKCNNVKFFSAAIEVFRPEFRILKSSKISTWPAYIRGHVAHVIDLLPFKINKLRNLILPKGIE
jgi:hypothetical protein